MDVWMSVGGVIGQKLTEIGQERMFNHLHEAVLSGLTLDVADFKESMDHKLIHLVWRKVPRNTDSSAGNVAVNSEIIVRKPQEIPPEIKKRKRRRRKQQQRRRENSFLPVDSDSGSVTALDTSNLSIPLQEECSTVPTSSAQPSLKSECLDAEEAGEDGIRGQKSSSAELIYSDGLSAGHTRCEDIRSEKKGPGWIFVPRIVKSRTSTRYG